MTSRTRIIPRQNPSNSEMPGGGGGGGERRSLLTDLRLVASGLFESLKPAGHLRQRLPLLVALLGKALKQPCVELHDQRWIAGRLLGSSARPAPGSRIPRSRCCADPAPKLHGGRSDVLLEAVELGRAGYRYDAGLVRQEPGERHLRRGYFLCSGYVADGLDDRLVSLRAPARNAERCCGSRCWRSSCWRRLRGSGIPCPGG